nr:hypothetical protein [Cytophagales bacterium]
MRRSLSIKANTLLFIISIMLMHSAFPHVHHGHEEHTHLGTQSGHSHDHHAEYESENVENTSLFDLFVHYHAHASHLPLTISVNFKKSDLIDKEYWKIIDLTPSTSSELFIAPTLDIKKRRNHVDEPLKSLFFTYNSERGPPELP